MAAEQEEQERIERESRERVAAREAILAEREAKKAAKIAEEEEKKAKAKAAVQRLKDQANAAAAAEQKAAEEKEAARVAALTPEQRAAEEEAKQAAIRAEEERREKALAELEAAMNGGGMAEEAAEDSRAAAPKVVVSELPPVGAGFSKASGPATAASVLAILDAAEAEVGEKPKRLLSLSALHEDMRGALEASVAELEAGYESLSEAELRAELLGFWQLRMTSDAALASTGSVGFGGSSSRYTLAQFQMFTEPDNYEPRPTLQTVEVVSDARAGKSVLASLKGDFYLGTLATTGVLGVVEDYTRREYDDERMGDGSDLVPLRWSCVYCGDGLRIVRTDGDDSRLMIFAKGEALDVQEEMGRLSRLPVTAVASDEGWDGDEEDTRPLWQRRLDEENEREGFNRFGPPAVSGIP